jgi:hypothetical protein
MSVTDAHGNWQARFADRSELVVRATLGGAIIGVLDALDVVVGGFTEGVSMAGHVILLAVMLSLGGAVGALVGLCLAAGAAALGRRMAGLQPHHLQSALALSLGLASAALVWGFRMLFPVFPVGVAVGALVAGVALAGVAWRLRFRRGVDRLVWVVLFAWAYAVGARLLYSFSRDGAATAVHAGWALGLCVLSAAMVPRLGRRPRDGRRALVMAGAALVMLALMPAIVARTGYAVQLILHERTSLAYRLLAVLPHHEIEREELARGCDPLPAESPIVSTPSSRRTKLRGVVLVMVDALRGDRVPSETTTRITALAKDGLRFDQVYAPAPVTRRSVAGMMTGAHLGDEGARSIVPTLKGAMVQTIALTANHHLGRWWRDFDVHEELTPAVKANNESRSSKRAFERARAHLDGISPDQRFFLFVHFYDPHAQYVSNEMFPAGASLASRYDAEVAYADHFIGKLVDHLDASAMAEDVAVLVVGDHGEELWDHRYHWHRARVYDESVRVPLALRVPGGPVGRVDHRLASTMDVGPTVLDLFGLSARAGLPGLSLLGEGRRRELLVASDIYPTYALVRDDHKLIANLETGILELYDLVSDPAERHSRADDAGPLFDELRCRLAHRLPQK